MRSVKIYTNFNDNELTIESCSEIIQVLQKMYENIRQEIYNQSLGIRNLKKSLFFTAILFFLYIFTHLLFFIYLMPISVIASFLLSLVSAEYLSTQTRKQIKEQIQLYIKKREALLKQEQLKI
jgi:hypothetical protein